MNYWWVNQKQTFRQELAGGFMWSPKRNANRSRSAFYDFMTQVMPGDLIFSYANGAIIAIGVALGTAVTSKKPTDFGNAGATWSEEGWRVDVDFVRTNEQVFPKNHMHLIAPLLPMKYSPLRPDGKGNQVYLTSISQELGLLLIQLLGNPEISWPVADLSELAYDPDEQEMIRDQSLPATVKSTLILARRGQGKFRDRVKLFEGSCRITGVDQSDLLVASHIKPWAVSNNEERLNGHNGLFLSPHVDKLFDSGYISFEKNGSLLVSPALDHEVLRNWSIDTNKKVKPFGADQDFFLDFHRQSVFVPG